MKKLFLLLLTGSSIVATHAQIKLGIKGGVNFSTINIVSTINSEDFGKVSIIAGLHLGALASLPLISHFSLQPELFYSAQGAKSTEVGVTANLNMNYLNFPVLVKYNNPTGFFAETGPQVGSLLAAKLKFPEFNEDEKSGFKSTDWSWAFGVGYFFKDLGLGIDARYNLGLSNFIDLSYNGQARNRVFQVGVFCLFGLKATSDH